MKKNGFTLMEVLIAAMLLGLVALTASVIHTAAASFLRQSSSNAKSQDEAAIIMERILRDIRKGYFCDYYASGPNLLGIVIYTQPEPVSTVPPRHYSLFVDPHIEYRLDLITGNLLYAPAGSTTTQTISTKITYLNFEEIPDFSNPANDNHINVKVSLTAEVDGKPTALESTATLLYRPVNSPFDY